MKNLETRANNEQTTENKNRNGFFAVLARGAQYVALCSVIALSGCGKSDNPVASNPEYYVKKEISTSLNKYPAQFLENGPYQIIVGENAPSDDMVAAIDIATGLASAELTYVQMSGYERSANSISSLDLVFLDTAAKELNTINTIVVGSPCTNKYAAELMGNKSDCLEGLVEDRGLIKMKRNGDYVSMLVSGYSSADIRRAARAVKADKLKTLWDNMTEATVSPAY